MSIETFHKGKKSGKENDGNVGKKWPRLFCSKNEPLIKTVSRASFSPEAFSHPVFCPLLVIGDDGYDCLLKVIKLSKQIFSMAANENFIVPENPITSAFINKH